MGWHRSVEIVVHNDHPEPLSCVGKVELDDSARPFGLAFGPAITFRVDEWHDEAGLGPDGWTFVGVALASGCGASGRGWRLRRL